MKSSKGDALDHPVTELEAVRSILVQGLPLLDQELTESSIVQVCGTKTKRWCLLIIIGVAYSSSSITIIVVSSGRQQGILVTMDWIELRSANYTAPTCVRPLHVRALFLFPYG